MEDRDLVGTGVVPPFAWKVSPQRPGRAFRSLVIQQTLAASSELGAGHGPGRGGAGWRTGEGFSNLPNTY